MLELKKKNEVRQPVVSKRAKIMKVMRLILRYVQELMSMKKKRQPKRRRKESN